MNLEEKENIKKSLLGKSQMVKIIYPPGFGVIALDEVKFILSNLWLAKAFKGEILQLKNEIRIQRIYLYAVCELLLRSQCLSDIRLIIYSGKVVGKKAFEKACRGIAWKNYINKTMTVKIKVDSVASLAFHESSLKEMVSNVINDYVANVVSGELAEETTCIHADLYKDKLIISLSLAGNPLYKKGYRGTLSASAPLREDFASCAMQRALTFAAGINKSFYPKNIIIPFSGTGTFAFEYLLARFKISPSLFDREYAIQKMPFFKVEYFTNILQKANEKCALTPSEIATPYIYCIDNSANANQALSHNIKRFNDVLIKNNFPAAVINQSKDDFFSMAIVDMFSSNNANLGDTFVMLNPPYGVRLSKSSDTPDLYKKIAKKLNEISNVLKSKQHNMLGFILCPSEESWSSFCKHLQHSKIETYHFTQGGMDIRVCQFYV